MFCECTRWVLPHCRVHQILMPLTSSFRSPKVCFIAGYAVMVILNIATGFCRSVVPFDICRGLCGIGGALVTPNAAALLGKQCT